MSDEPEKAAEPLKFRTALYGVEYPYRSTVYDREKDPNRHLYDGTTDGDGPIHHTKRSWRIIMFADKMAKAIEDGNLDDAAIAAYHYRQTVGR